MLQPLSRKFSTFATRLAERYRGVELCIVSIAHSTLQSNEQIDLNSNPQYKIGEEERREV